MTPVRRLEHEPAGKYEPESVPDSHLEWMSPMGTLAGYALPRVFVEQLGTTQDLSQEEIRDRLRGGLEVLDTVLPKSRSPLELLALFSEGLVARGQITPAQVF